VSVLRCTSRIRETRNASQQIKKIKRKIEISTGNTPNSPTQKPRKKKEVKNE
jgi:hypothetical protein